MGRFLSKIKNVAMFGHERRLEEWRIETVISHEESLDEIPLDLSLS